MSAAPWRRYISATRSVLSFIRHATFRASHYGVRSLIYREDAFCRHAQRCCRCRRLATQNMNRYHTGINITRLTCAAPSASRARYYAFCYHAVLYALRLDRRSSTTFIRAPSGLTRYAFRCPCCCRRLLLEMVTRRVIIRVYARQAMSARYEPST